MSGDPRWGLIWGMVGGSHSLMVIVADDGG